MGHLFRYNQGSYNGGGNNQYNNYNRNRSFPQPAQFDYYPRVRRQEQQQRLMDSYRNTTTGVRGRYPQPLFSPQQQLQAPPPPPPQQQQYPTSANDFATALINLFTPPTTVPTTPDLSSPSSPPPHKQQQNIRERRRHHRHGQSRRRRHRHTTPTHHRFPPATSTSGAAHHHDKRPCSASSSVSPTSSSRKRVKTTPTTVPPQASLTLHKIKIPEGSDAKESTPRRWDPYCWVCHSSDPKSSKNDAGSVSSAAMLRCGSCPRSFHEPCFKTTNKMSATTALTRQQPRPKSRSFVCLECQNVNGGGGNQYLTQTKLEITPERFKRFFEFTMRRVRLLMISNKSIDVSPFFPTDADKIVYPLDLNIIEQNICRLKYTSTNAFMSDIRWLFHNAAIVYTPGPLAASSNPSPSGGGLNTAPILSTLRKFEKACEEEVSEMNTCPECYQNSYSRDDWFAVVCTPVHTLVWAKVKGFCYWPGKALRIRPAAPISSPPSSTSSTKSDCVKQDVVSMVDVRFFGKHDKAWVPVTHCYLMSENPPFNTATNRSTRKNRGYEESMEELAIHLTYIQSMYNCPFPYAPDDTPFTHTPPPHTDDRPLNHLHALLVAGVRQNQPPPHRLSPPKPPQTLTPGAKSLDNTPKPPYVLIKRAQFALDVEPMCFTKSKKDPTILTAYPRPLVKTEFVDPDESGVNHAPTDSPLYSHKFEVGLITSAMLENLVVILTLVPPSPPSPRPPTPVALEDTAAIAPPPSINEPAENNYRDAVAEPQAPPSESSTIVESLAPLHNDPGVHDELNVKVEHNPPLQTTASAVHKSVANDAALPQASVKQEVLPNEQLPDYESINSGHSIDVGDRSSLASPDVTFVAQFQDTTNSDLSAKSYASRADNILKSLQQANKDYPRLTIGNLSNTKSKNRKSPSSSSSRSDHKEPKSTKLIEVKKIDKEVKDLPLSVSSNNKSPRPIAAPSTPPISSPSNGINNNPAPPILANTTSEPEDVKPNHLNLHHTPQPSNQPDPTPVSEKASTSSFTPVTAVKIESGLAQTDARTAKCSLSTVSTLNGLSGGIDQPRSSLALDTTSSSSCKRNSGPPPLPPTPCGEVALNVSGTVAVTMHAVTSTVVVAIKQEPPNFTTTSANTDKRGGEAPRSTTPSPNVTVRAKEKTLTNSEPPTFKTANIDKRVGDAPRSTPSPNVTVRAKEKCLTNTQPPTFKTANIDKRVGNGPRSTPSPNITVRAKEKSMTNTEAQSIKKGLNRALSILSSSIPHTTSSSVVSSTRATLLSPSIPESTHISPAVRPSILISYRQTLAPSVVVTQPLFSSTEKIISDLLPSRQSLVTVNPTLTTILNTKPISRSLLPPTPAISSAIYTSSMIRSNITAIPQLPSPSFIGPTFGPIAPRATSTTIGLHLSPRNNLTDSSCAYNLDSLADHSLLQPNAAVISPPTGLSSAPNLGENGSLTTTNTISPDVHQPAEASFDASPFISQVVEIMKNMTRQFQNYATTPVPPPLKPLPTFEPTSSKYPSQVVEKGGDDVISLKEHQNHLVIMWQNAKTFYSKKIEAMQKSFQLYYNQMERSVSLCNDKLAQRDSKIQELENHFNAEIQKHKNELSQCYGTINKLQTEVKAEREQMQKTIEGIKRKQWCVACLKEAVYYCCVGIWYCDKSCQIAHWEVHKDVCEEMKKKNAEATPPKRSHDNFNNLIQPRRPNYMAGGYFTPYQQPVNNDMFVNGLPGPFSITNHCSNNSTAPKYYPFTTENNLPNISYQRIRDPSRAPLNCGPLEGLKSFIPTSQQRH